MLEEAVLQIRIYPVYSRIPILNASNSWNIDLLQKSRFSISKSLLQWSVLVASWWPFDITMTLQWLFGDITVTPLWPLCDLLMTSQYDEKSFFKSLWASTPILMHSPIRTAITHPEGGSFQWSGRLWSEPTSSVRFLYSSSEWPPSACDTWPVSSWLPLAFDPTLMSHLATPLPQGWEWSWPGVPFHRWTHRNQGCL